MASEPDGDHGRTARRPDHASVDRAAAIVRDQLAPTPLVRSPVRGLAADGDVLLKLETAQPTGSFKVRGALAALSRPGPSAKIVTASTGNHALGVAFAAQRLGQDLRPQPGAGSAPSVVGSPVT